MAAGFSLNKLGSQLYGISLPPEQDYCLFKDLKLENDFFKKFFCNIQDKDKLNKLLRQYNLILLFT